MNNRLSIVVPCYGRPLRTKRIIENICSQDIDGWEAFIMGDGCDHFKTLISSGWIAKATREAEKRGNRIWYGNLKHHGGFGYHIMNYAIRHAKGKYFIWAANDDTLLPNHFRNYLEIEEHPELDYMYFNSYIAPSKSTRDTTAAYCYIGHSEIIVKTEFLKSLTEVKSHYGHDWDTINEMIQKGKGQKAQSTLETYHVMSVPSIGCADTID